MSPKLFLLLVALVCYFMIPVDSGRVHKSKRSALESAFKAKKFVIRLRRDAEPPVVETQIVESVDWASWLQGVVADTEGVAATFNNHRLDFDTLSKLDANSLQSIGISSEDSAKIVSKIALESWLTGVVSNDDISFVIKACLENRITLESLTKLTLADIASTGIALGDATRIYAKSHPQADAATTLPAAVDALPNTTTPITINIVLTGADNTTTVASIQIGANLTADNSTTITASINAVDNTTTATTEVEEDEDEDEDDEEETEIILVEPTVITTATKRSALRNKRSVEGKRKSTAEKKGKKKSGDKKKTKKTKKNKKQSGTY